jgi:hypothetical protein
VTRSHTWARVPPRLNRVVAVKNSLISRVAVALVALAALALPALAAAEAPSLGRYHGAEGVNFVVGHTEHGSLVVESIGYHEHSGFPRAYVHSGSFESCARVHVNRIIFREYCVHGTFGASGHASGTVKVHQGAMGHKAEMPYETHHWTAALG